MGYFAGVFPPGKKNVQLTAIVHKNLLIAHTRVYYELKNMKNGDNARIGIVKNVMQFDPSRRWHLLDWISCRITDVVYNKMSLSFLQTGKNISYSRSVARAHYKSDTKMGEQSSYGLHLQYIQPLEDDPYGPEVHGGLKIDF